MGCNKCLDEKEYCGTMPACFEKGLPKCPAVAVIPSMTLDTTEGLKQLSNTVVHVISNNTTYYVDDKHRITEICSEPVSRDNYDFANNPEKFAGQIVFDYANNIAFYYDNSGRAFEIAEDFQGAIAAEANARITADNDLQTEINNLKNSPDVVDIVDTYADLEAYDTQHLGDNDIIRVLTDETHDGESSYYRWDKQNETWTFIGSINYVYTGGNGIDVTDNEVSVKLGRGLAFDNDGDVDVSEDYIIGFDTVVDMQSAENLVDGSYAQTLGYYTIGDGGGAKYRITNEEPSGIYITISESLYAELVIENNTLYTKQTGAKGDGETDDTTTIQTAINQMHTLGVNKLVFPSGNYIVSGEITLPSEFILEGMEGSTLSYTGEGTTGNIISVIGEDADNPIENVKIINIKIDGTNQNYKGGASGDNPKNTNTNPEYKGLIAIRVGKGKNVEISNCTLNDIYGDGIKVSGSTNVRILNNSLYSVGGGNIASADDFGDGIVAFSSYNVNIEDNTVINRRTYKAGWSSAIGKPCGRSGLEYEYAINENAPTAYPDDPDYNAPDYEDLPVVIESGKSYRYGVGLRVKNNYVYGYTKGVHVETKVKTIIEGNTLLYNHIGVMDSTNNQNIITGNYIDTLSVGAAPQMGYDGYYGGIAISEYNVTSKKYGTVVSNNNLNGDGKGVTLGASNVTIIGNTFNCAYGVYTVQENTRGIIINGNTFNDANIDSLTSFLFIYHTQSCVISNNSFYASAPTRIVTNGSNIKIKNNDFVNTGINSEYGGNNYEIDSNIFKNSGFTVSLIGLYNLQNSIISNNDFNASSFNTNDACIIRMTGNTVRCSFVNNKFEVETTLSSVSLIKPENIWNSVFDKNKLLTDNSALILINTAESHSSTVTNNTISNTLGTVFKVRGSAMGMSVITSNIGVITVSGLQPNTSSSCFGGEYLQRSQQMLRFDITDGASKCGYVCVRSGYYTAAVWESTTYSAGKMLKNSSGNVYKLITAGGGVSTVEPTQTTGEVTESDGYKWKYLGAVAIINELTK